MKVPNNIWKNILSPNDWDFSCIINGHSEELAACVDWEFGREYAQASTGGIFPENPFPRPPTIEEAVTGHWRDQSGIPKPLPDLPAYWIAHPDFPLLSYIDSRQKGGWAKEDRPDTNSGSLIHCDWASVTDGFGGRFDEIIQETGTLWFNQTEIVPFQIPWRMRNDEIVDCFRDWLKMNRPKGDSGDFRPPVPEPKPSSTIRRPTGAASEPRQFKAHLKALGAWRLIQRYQGDNWAAFEHPNAAKILGKQFDAPGAWSSARSRVKKVLAENFGLSHLD